MTEASSPLLDFLKKRQLVTVDQLMVVKKDQILTSKTTEQCLIDLGFLTEKTLAEIYSEMSGYNRINLKETFLNATFVKKLPREIAEKYLVLLLDIRGNKLDLVMADVYNISALEAIQTAISDVQQINPMIAEAQDIRNAIEYYYGYEMSIQGLLREIEQDKNTPLESDETSPNIRLVNAIIWDAIRSKSSDIHFEPEGPFTRIRYRIDGLLKQVTTFHSIYWTAICVRLKIMAEMNIAEARRPQTGRLTFSFGAKSVDLRVSSHPTIYGENIVIRILDKNQSLLPLSQLGYSSSMMEDIKKVLTASHGIIVITGPTGSGKTTSLYSMLNYISSTQLNIMTLEDPIEYQLPLIRQTQIKAAAGISFADGIRSILRQDPDVILVGEVRDTETAQMALRAAMTGHLVFTTLHTNDAVSVIDRFSELGLLKSMILRNLRAVIAQRLVRCICDFCKKEYKKSGNEDVSYRPLGCEQCHFTGYKGRTAIAEILIFDEEIRDFFVTDHKISARLHFLRKKNFSPLLTEGKKLISLGKTTLEEVERVVGKYN